MRYRTAAASTIHHPAVFVEADQFLAFHRVKDTAENQTFRATVFFT